MARKNVQGWRRCNACSVVTLAAVLNGCNGSDNGGGPNPSPTATPRATAQATPTTAPVTVGDVTGTYSLGNGAERGTVILRNVRQNGTATGTIASPALQNPAPLSGTITNGRLTAQSTAQPDRNGRSTVYGCRGIVITVNALAITPHDVDINSGVVEKRQSGSLVASGTYNVSQNPTVSPFAGIKTGTFTITRGFGFMATNALKASVSKEGVITATINVPTTIGLVAVSISGIVDAATGQLTIVGTNSSTAAGPVILSLSGRLASGGTGSGTFNLSRLQNGSATEISSGTFAFGTIFTPTPTPTPTQPGGTVSFFPGNYSIAYDFGSPHRGLLTIGLNSSGAVTSTTTTFSGLSSTGGVTNVYSISGIVGSTGTLNLSAIPSGGGETLNFQANLIRQGGTVGGNGQITTDDGQVEGTFRATKV